MSRRLIAFVLSLGLTFGPVVPSFAGDPILPVGGNNGGGDQTSFDGFQDGQNQDQNDQNFRVGVNCAMSAQGGDEGPSFGRLPTYSEEIAWDGAFTAQVQIDNDNGQNEPVTLLFAFNDIFTGVTHEIYKAVQVDGNGEAFDVTLSNTQLNQNGVGPGRYRVAFVAFDRNDQRLGDGFYGNSFTRGEIEPTFTGAPSYTRVIGANGVFAGTFNVGNTGDTADRVTLVTVITPAGTNNSREFSRAVDVAPGGGDLRMEMTAQELRDAGINIGRHLVTFLVLDAEGNRVGTPFYGNPLTIGSTQPSVGGLPAYDGTIPLNGEFSSNWSMGNAGDAPDKVTLLTVITRLGGGDASSREFYKAVDLAAGGGAFNFNITAAELAAAGITGGRCLVTFAAYDGAGAVVGAPFYGNRLDVGAMEPAFGALPDYTGSLDDSAAFQATFNLGNTGDASDRATLITVITPLGTQNSKEFYRLVTLPPGGGAFGMEMTAQELRDAGIGVGEFLVTFLVLNGWGERVGTGFFGNRLSIGNAEVTLGQAPAYSNAIDEDDDFTAQWTLGNGGPVDSPVVLLTVITPVGATDSHEFYRTVQVPAGGGLVDVTLTAAELAVAGFGPGEYLISFAAFNPSDVKLGEFFGNRLDIIELGNPEAFLIAHQIANNGFAGILRTWDVPAGDPMEVYLADRAFTYDEAVAVIALVRAGKAENARQILEALQRLENNTGLLGFVYAVGPRGEDFLSLFTGTLAWTGWAAVEYEKATGDSQFRDFAKRLADTILGFTDPATGLLKGGQDADGNAFPWISTEHNLDAYFFLRDLGALSGDDTYSDAADALEGAIMTHLWSGSHFHQGYQDDLVVLDVQALGGLFLLATGRRAETEGLRTFIEDALSVDVSVNGQNVHGYAPYWDDDFIWTEGTAMVALFDRRLGDFASADALEQGLRNFQDAAGGLGYASSRSQTTAPGQDTVFPELSHVGATAWLLMQGQNARGLFTPDVENVFNTLPAYADPIGRDGDFTASFTVAHEGAPGALTLVTAITPVGGGASQEFSSQVTGVPPSNVFNVTLTDAQLDAAGIAPGRYLVTFLVIDADGDRVGQPFFGNPLTRGVIGLDFDSEFDIGNSGDTADTVTPTLVFTPGFYTIRFLAHDGFGDSISDSFFSALVEFLMG